MELRKFSLEFIDEFTAIKNNPNILNNGYDKTPNPYTIKDAELFFKQQIDEEIPKRFLIFFDNKLAGEIGITIKDDVFRLNAEIGYFIAESFWGKGLATRAIGQMTDYAFINFNIVRIVAGVFDFNKSSMKALEKNGYYLECIRKKSVIKNDKIIDDYIWVKLKEE